MRLYHCRNSVVVGASTIIFIFFQLGNVSSLSQPPVVATAVGSVSSSPICADRDGVSVDRRDVFRRACGTLSFLSTAVPTVANSATGGGIVDKEFLQKYEDFVKAPDGCQYKDVKLGEGSIADMGDRVVFEWSGYTIGYFGRPFEAKGGPQGGAFDKTLDYSRVKIGSGTIVPGVERALATMKPGGIRQVIVPYGPNGYPPDDMEHERVGPKPTTFSGVRALNFVLENQRVDRTLLFNVKVIRIDRVDGKGGFRRG